MTGLRFLRGLRRGDVFLEYQPIVSLSSGEPQAAEALVRWRHPRHGLIDPASFVPQVERGSGGDRLDRFVLETAAEQARTLREMGIHVPLAVNLRPAAFQDPGLPRRLRELRSHWGLPPEALQIELTERALGEGDLPAQTIRGLADEGVPVALDDFGVGYSSLKRLAHLPLSAVKIDRSFVKQIADSPEPRDEGERRARLVVKAAAELAHALDLNVTAEGVETVGAWHLLGALGVDAAQGFLISVPVAEGHLVHRLRENALEIIEGDRQPPVRPDVIARPTRADSKVAVIGQLRRSPYG
jgi:EAL domain-containing protein (putative c-di-GMP-specific phosphodiesterase class I)